MRAIVAIGGGELGLGETRAIDEYIVSLPYALIPRVLFIPTASGDHAGYIECFTKAYGELGCRVNTLRLYGTCPDTPEDIAAKFSAADIIYVGGGDTDMMLAKWRKAGVDAHLRAAYERGVVLSGLSAGALCWASCGMTDRPDDDDFIPGWLEGLALVPFGIGVHYDEPFWQQLNSLAARQDKPVNALENCTALSVIDGHMTIVRSRKDRAAWLLRPVNGGIVKTRYEGGYV